MDPLSDVLTLLKPKSFRLANIDAGGDWAIQFREHEGLKFQAIRKGQCWLTVEGVDEPLLVKEGECFLLTKGRPFRIASDLSITPVDAKSIFPPVYTGAVVTVNGGGEFFSGGSVFRMYSEHAGLLLKMLPPVIHIRRGSDQEALQWALERMMQEVRDPQPGSEVLTQHLACMILVQALRLHVMETAKGSVGWLFALADAQMGKAISAMHESPSQGWTLQDLAEHVGMSRSTFAERFKQTVGTSPMEYLTQWRMLLAGDKLTSTTDSVSSIAFSLGYESESSFSTAFKRVMGMSPRKYSRSRALAT